MHSSLLASFLSFFFTFFWLIRTVDNINLLTQTDGKRRRAKSPSEVPGSWARPGVAYFWDQVPDRRPFGRWPDLAECSAWIMRAHSSINFHSFRHSPNFSLFAVRVPVLVPKPKAEKIHTSREQCSSDHVLDHFLIVLAVGGPPSPFCGFRNSVCVSVSVRAFRLRVYLIGNVHPTMATHKTQTHTKHFFRWLAAIARLWLQPFDSI